MKFLGDGLIMFMYEYVPSFEVIMMRHDQQGHGGRTWRNIIS